LCVFLAGELALGGGAVKISPGTIVQSGVEIHPYLDLRLAHVRNWRRSFRETQANQRALEQ
jgi:hypothetical protein